MASVIQNRALPGNYMSATLMVFFVVNIQVYTPQKYFTIKVPKLAGNDSWARV